MNRGIPYCFPVKREAQNAEAINFFGILVDLTINSAGTTKKLRFARKYACRDGGFHRFAGNGATATAAAKCRNRTNKLDGGPLQPSCKAE
ncbi:hypothetical protein [Rhizobium subbaraonis]|uniref:hypothetical protein n=1 Tax=Rhizobium subbaraonis TaxID=908946 RepID=UPI001142BDA5|nr:hypothetical protein [Rhizobium subbaraonis]